MICLDSTCIIDYLKGNKKAIGIFEKYKNELTTTEINVFEIFHGIYLKQKFDEEEIAKEFFNSIEVMPFDKTCGKIAAKIFTDLDKIGQYIEQNDCFIAAIMKKNRCEEVLTRNEKHFSRIKDIKVVSY